AGNDSQMWELLTRSVSSFVTLFRHALTALGESAPLSKRETVQALATKVGFDATGILQVLDIREGRTDRRKLNVSEIFPLYLGALEHVTSAVDRMLDSSEGPSR